MLITDEQKEEHLPLEEEMPPPLPVPPPDELEKTEIETASTATTASAKPPKVDKRKLRTKGNRTPAQQKAWERLQAGREKYQAKKREEKLGLIETQAEALIRNKAKNKKNKETQIKALVKRVMLDEAGQESAGDSGSDTENEAIVRKIVARKQKPKAKSPKQEAVVEEAEPAPEEITHREWAMRIGF